jgi:hypothetical protein
MTDSIYGATVLLPWSRKMLKHFSTVAMILTLTFLSVKQVKASSLTLTFNSDASGIALGGSGTSAATINFGNVQAFGGTVPSGVTKSINGTTSWTLSTPIDVLVTKTGCGNCASYTMTAQLQTSDPTNTWQFGSVIVTNASPATVTAAGAFGSSTPYKFSLTVPFSEQAGTVNNTLDIIVTAN